MVQLVTPNQVQTNLPLGSNDEVGSTDEPEGGLAGF